VLYTDETPYRSQKDWLNEMPFDIYSVNVHTGEKQFLPHGPAPTNQHIRELLPSIFGKQCHRYISNIEDGNNGYESAK